MGREKQLENLQIKTQTLDLKDATGENVVQYSYPGFDERQIGFLVYGKNLDQEKLYKYFRGAMMEMKKPMKLVTKEEVLADTETLRNLDHKFQSKFIDDNFHYDGYMFRNRDGNVQKHHPNISKIVDLYLTNVNKENVEKNFEIEKECKVIE